jgi:hypothetical protein
MDRFIVYICGDCHTQMQWAGEDWKCRNGHMANAIAYIAVVVRRATEEEERGS